MPTSRSFALSPTATATPFFQKHKMSLTQTYYLAHTARSKLSKEASRPEYNLRVLVGHANLLDGLMIELADAEREQENWFNESVRRAETSTATTTSSSPAKSSTISWADTLPPVVEDDSEEGSDEEMADQHVAPRRRAPTPPMYASITEMEVDSESESESDDDIAEDEESDSDELALTRTDSRSSFSSPPDSPPELLHELTSDEEEEDSNTPPSPPTTSLPAPHSAPHSKGGKHGHQMTVSLKQDNDWQLSSAARESRSQELYI